MCGFLQVGKKSNSLETSRSEPANKYLYLTGSCPLRMVAHSCVLWMTPTITSCLFGTGRRRSNWPRSRYPSVPRSRFGFGLQAAAKRVFLSLAPVSAVLQ